MAEIYAERCPGHISHKTFALFQPFAGVQTQDEYSRRKQAHSECHAVEAALKQYTVCPCHEQRQNADLQALNQRLSGEFQNETEKYNNALRDSIKHFLASYNKDKKYSLILSKAGDNILYADKAHDITNDVIAGLNKAYKSSPAMKTPEADKKKK